MKKAKAENEQEEETLPFSFSKRDPGSERVKKHWQKIEEKINAVQQPVKGNKEENHL